MIDSWELSEGREQAVRKTDGEETASEEERTAFFRAIRQAEYDKLMTAVGGENTDGENATAQLIITNGEDTAITSFTEEETAGEEERLAFFQSIRDAEYKKLVEAAERDRVRKEQKKAKKAKKTLVTEKQCDYFFNVTDDNSTTVCTEMTTQQNDYYQEPSTSTTETYSTFLKPSPKCVPSISNTSTHSTVDRTDNKDTDSTQVVSTATEDKRPFDRSFSDVGVKRQQSINGLILKLFKRSKSMSNFQKDRPTQTCELKEIVKEEVIKKQDLPHVDIDDFVEPPKPRLKPFFSIEEDVKDTLKVKEINTEEEIPRQNIFARSGRRIRSWFKGLSCCCCKPDMVESSS